MPTPVVRYEDCTLVVPFGNERELCKPVEAMHRVLEQRSAGGLDLSGDVSARSDPKSSCRISELGFENQSGTVPKAHRILLSRDYQDTPPHQSINDQRPFISSILSCRQVTHRTCGHCLARNSPKEPEMVEEVSASCLDTPRSTRPYSDAPSDPLRPFQ